MKPADTLLDKLRSSVKLFDGFTQYEVAEFIEQTYRVQAAAFEAVINEDEPGREMFIIISGEFRVARKLKTGQQKTIAKLSPGDTFGELSLLDNRPRSASVYAETNGILLCFEGRQLVKVPDLCTKLYRNMALMMSMRLRDADQLLSVIMDNQARPEQPNTPRKVIQRNK